MAMPTAYPIQFLVDPPAPQNRLTVLVRIFLAIPHFIILYFLRLALQVVSIIAWFAILIVGRYPRGMYAFAAGCARWQALVNGYLFLLTDKYPPFALDDMADYPLRFLTSDETENRNRLTTFFRLFMVIPHLFVLAFIGIAASVVLVIAWFAALIVGYVPAGMHGFLAGYNRWSARVNAYFDLLTDVYPPFSLE